MTTPSALERQVGGALRRAGFSPGGATLVVAVSGGPDSTALLRCLHRLSDGALRGEYRLTLHVAHLNHDFRGAEADHDAAFVLRLAEGLGLPCSIDKQDPIAYQRQRGVSSFEQAAREMRYAFLGSVAATAGATTVALGHTADDQAETVLLHLLRGSGLHGLRGMAEVAAWPWPEPRPGPSLFRPLLGLTKADTAAYCRALGQPYREDSGNYLWRFTRNKVRHDLMPRLARDYNPRVRESLTRLSRAAAEEVDYIEGELDRHWPAIAAELDGEVRIDVSLLASLHPALQRHAFRRAYAAVVGDARALGESHIAAMLSLLRGEQGGRAIDLPRGVRLNRSGGALLLTHHDSSAFPCPELTGEHEVGFSSSPGEEISHRTGGWLITLKTIGAGENCPRDAGPPGSFSACFNRDALGTGATVRTRRPGDRFQPSGMTGHKKLQDFFTDAKVPREQRDHVPLLVCENGIAWVVGHRVAGWAAATAASPALWIAFTPAGEYAGGESV